MATSPILFLHGLATEVNLGDNGWIDLVDEANRESLVIDLPMEKLCSVRICDF